MYRNEPADPPMDEEPEDEYPRIVKLQPLPVMVCTGCNARRPPVLPFIEGIPHKDCPGHPGEWHAEQQEIEYRIAYGNGLSLPVPPAPEEPNVFEDMERDEALLELDAKHSTADEDVIRASEKYDRFDIAAVRVLETVSDKRSPTDAWIKKIAAIIKDELTPTNQDIIGWFTDGLVDVASSNIAGLQEQIERYANRLNDAQHMIAGLRGALETSAKVVSTIVTELKTTREALISTGEMWAQANKAYGMAEAEKLEMAGTIRDLRDQLSRKEIALTAMGNAVDYERRNLDLARRQVGEWGALDPFAISEADGAQ